MKKILLLVIAVALSSVAAFAIEKPEGSGPCGIWLCEDSTTLMNRPHCEELQPRDPRLQSQKCCWKNAPTNIVPERDCPAWWEQHNGGAKGGDRGGKSGNSVCEKLIYPEIVHRPRCSDFGQSQCKQYDPIKHCEDLYGQETHGKLAACCWVGQQPNEVGGRGSTGGSKGTQTTLKGKVNVKNNAKVNAPAKGAKANAKPSTRVAKEVK